MVRSISIAVLIAMLGMAIAAQSTPPRPVPAPRAQTSRATSDPDPREATARRLCGQCHPYEFVIGVSRTRAQWEEIVQNMIGRGARGTNAEFSEIVDYLAAAHVLAPSAVRSASGPADKMMVDPQAAQAAKPLYTSNCLACHGADARGTAQGANLVRSVVVLKDRYGSTVGPYLRTTHPNSVKFEALSSRDVLLLSHFLRERINDTLRGAPPFKPGNVLTGDSRAGADYFNGEGGCTQCHSATGDLAGIGRRLEPINIQQRFLFPHTVRRPGAKVVTVTITTESGETLTGPLERMDDFHVTVRDESGAYRTIRRTAGTRVVKNDPFAAHVALLPRLTDKNMHDVVAYLESLK